MAALVAIGAFLVLRSDEPDLQWQGEAIAEPETTLEAAEAVLASLVDERHGAVADDSRCYFSLPEDESVKDIADQVRCGPVLFVDGDASEPYLSFPLTAAGADGDLRLDVGDRPVEPEPTALDPGERLARPDDAQPPEGRGGLDPPEPPPAADDLLAAVDLGPTPLDTAPEGGTIGSLNRRYELVGLGTIDRYGSGDEARGAAEGHELIAFDLAEGLGESIESTTRPTVQVQIDDQDPRDIGDLIGDADPVVVSVPHDAGTIDIVVTDAEIVQRLSLVDGTPAAGNLRVLTRANRSQAVNAVHQVSATGRDATGQGPVTGTITVADVQLDWFLPGDPATRASSADAALLTVVLDYAWVEVTPADAGLAEQAFTLVLPDGGTIAAKNLAPDAATQVIVAFEVPADFTTATLNIGGSVPQPGGLTIDFGGNVYPTPLSIPAG